MNIRKPNQLRFSRLFNFNESLYKIKFVGIKVDNIPKGILSVYDLDINNRMVLSFKSFHIKTENNQNNVFRYLHRLISDENQVNVIKQYISNNL